MHAYSDQHLSLPQRLHLSIPSSKLEQYTDPFKGVVLFDMLLIMHRTSTHQLGGPAQDDPELGIDFPS